MPESDARSVCCDGTLHPQDPSISQRQSDGQSGNLTVPSVKPPFRRVPLRIVILSFLGQPACPPDVTEQDRAASVVAVHTQTAPHHRD